MMRLPLRFMSLASALMLSTAACAAAPETASSEYGLFIDSLKKEMVGRGISQKTVDDVYKNSYAAPNDSVVKIDRKQTEFVLTSSDYLNRVVNQKRVQTAQKHYKELYPVLKKIQDKYGVQPHYIIAFWAVETNFGQNFGGFQVVDVLTTLSYDKRRPKFFK